MDRNGNPPFEVRLRPDSSRIRLVQYGKTISLTPKEAVQAEQSP
jgi:hypothetical protein